MRGPGRIEPGSFGHSKADQLRYGVGIVALVKRYEHLSAQGDWAGLIDCSGATRGRNDAWSKVRMQVQGCWAGQTHQAAA